MKDPRLPFKSGILLSTFALALSTCVTFAPAQATESDQADTVTVANQLHEAADKEETNRLIVTFKDENKAQQEVALDQAEQKTGKLDGLEVVKESVAEDEGTVVVKSDDFLDKAEQKEAIAALEEDPRIESVEPDRIVHATAAAASSEPMFTLQWALGSSYLNANKAWDMGVSGKGQTVGIVDTGYTVHPDLPTPVAQYDFIGDTSYSLDGDGRDGSALDTSSHNSDANWHGSFVTGQIAAKVNGYGTTGLAYNAATVQARALGIYGDGYISDIADAITWAAGGAVAGVPQNPRPSTVINASLAYPSASCSTPMRKAINYALSKEIPVVVAAGNSGKDANNFEPSNCYRAIVVGATNVSNQLAGYSNYGSMLDVVAPGGDYQGRIYSTVNTGFSSVGSPTYGYKVGTSMAAPYVTSTIALMKEANPSLTVEQIRNTLTGTGTSMAGYRGINPAAAIAAVRPAAQFTVRQGSGIESAYVRGGGEGVYGKPTSNEFSIRDGGFAQNFAKNYTIYWHPTFGANAVNFNGSIGVKFAANKFENGYGFPVTAETALPGGAQQRFKTANGQETAIVWSASTGAHALNAQGAIYKYWSTRVSSLGYPTADETKNADGSITMTFSSGVQLRWTAQKGVQQIGFRDIAGNLFESQIKWIAERGITTGFSDGTYRPQENIQRAAMAAYFYRLAGSPAYTAPAVSPFKDVKTTDQFYKEIAWFEEKGITTGFEDGTFRPGESVNRDAMAAFFYRYAGSPKYSAPAKSPFTDIKAGDQFYKEIAWLANSGITTGYGDGTFRPVEAIHRDAMAAFVYRYAK